MQVENIVVKFDNIRLGDYISEHFNYAKKVFYGTEK